ncbi:hypothetical protein OAA91_00685 [Fibrobacterales bacterium]|nr:hypothetical protein [Fibrobacterales bacterium]
MLKKTIFSVTIALVGLSGMANAQSSTGESAGTSSFTSFGLGAAYLTNVDSKDMSYLVSAGKYFRAVDYAGIRLNTNFAFDVESSSYFSSTLLGMQAYFNNGVASTYGYIDFGLGYEYSRINSNQYGFSMAAGPGVIFFRKASAQLFIEPTWQIIFDDGTPQMWGLKIGLNY